MGKRDALLESIAKTIKTYRVDELEEATPEHVDCWAKQFSDANQLTFLKEFDHVMKQTFITKDAVSGFLSKLITNEELAGKDPKAYWARANLLRIQKKGQSQKEMLPLFARSLKEQCGLKLDACGADGGDYIYLDDVLFSGGRIGADLDSWIRNKAPKNATVHVILMAYFRLGQYYAQERLKKAAAEAGKNIDIKYWRIFDLENRKYEKNNSEVLWPAVVPNDANVKAYIASEKRFPLDPRTPGGKLGVFSSEEGRQVLESEFLVAGVKIRSLTQTPKDFIRPLGCSGFGVGFGSLIATYRNCPNNCPLALWWGDPEATSGALKWYPLLQRKTYSAPENVFSDFEDF